MWNGKKMISSVYGNGKNAARRYHGWTRLFFPPSSKLLTCWSKDNALLLNQFASFSNGGFWSSRWVSSPPSLLRSYCTGDSQADDALRQLSQTVEKWVEDLKEDGAAVVQPPPPPLSASLQWEFEEWSPAQAELWQAGLQKMMTTKTPVAEEVEILSGIEKLAPLKIKVEFSKANELSEITADDANKFFTFRKEDQSRHFPEGLPKCLAKEFETSRGNSLLIRAQLVKLCDHLRTLATPSVAECCESKPVELNGENAEAGLQPTEVPTSPEIEEFGKTLSKGDLDLNQRSFPHQSSSDVHEDSASHPENTVATQQEVSETSEHLKASTKNASLPYSKLKKPQFLSTVDLGPGKQIVIDGLRGSGKSTLLAMLVLWARSLGWLVFYVPSAKDWTRNHFYYKNEITGVWDTPLQAVSILESFLKASGTLIEKIPCRVFDPIILGEGPGIGPLQGVQELPVQEGFTLHDLVQMGIQTPHAAVSIVVRLKKELSLVTEVPVLIAIDEFNSWFTFSEFREAVTAFSVRNIHANELAMVQAFRNIVNGPITVATFSHSTAVGKLPKQHPGIPGHIKVYLDRYSFHEAVLMLKYYQRQLNKKVKTGRRIRKMLYVMTNGNATELRDISIVRSGLVGRGEAMAS